MGFVRGVISACLAGTVLLSFLARAHACRCLTPRHPPLLQEVFCSADFVFEFVPIRSDNLVVSREFYRRYEFNTTKVYKTSPEYESLSESKVIYTSINRCGKAFHIGRKYTILGNSTEGIVFIALCSNCRVIPSYQLTAYQIVQLESGYSRNCNKCQIQHCSSLEECDQLERNRSTCVFDHGSSSLLCSDRHGLCQSLTYRNNSLCEWDDDNGRLNTCRRETWT